MINPFGNRIASDPWRLEVSDVSEINSDVYRYCLAALERVADGGRSISVLLCGAPGTGKTHLLGRLRTHLESSDTLCIFIAVRLQTSPRRFWRNLRRYFIESLFRPSKNGKTQFERLLLRNIGEFMVRTGKRSPVPHDRLLSDYIEHLCYNRRIPGNYGSVIVNILRHKNMSAACSWLKGDSLSPDEQAKLGVIVESDDEPDSEDDAREAVKTLCRIAGEVKIAVCFDQIEALQRYPGDTGGLFIFGQAIRTLHDETDNVLMITCVQQFFLDHLRDAVTEPDFDALSEYFHSLQPLTEEQAVALVISRLEGTQAHCKRVENTEWMHKFRKSIQKLVKRGELTARRALFQCELAIGEEQGELWKKDLAGDPETEFLEREFRRRMDRYKGRIEGEKTDAWMQSVIPVMANILDETVTEADQDIPKDLDIVLVGKTGKIGISFCNHTDMNSLAARLRRIREQTAGVQLEKIVLIRNSGSPISLNAKKAREYLDELKMFGKAELIRPTDELIEALAALRDVISEAGSGDLVSGERSLSETAVRSWIRNHNPSGVGSFVEGMILGTSLRGNPDGYL